MTNQDVIDQISQPLGQHSLTSRPVIELFFEVVKQPPAAGESIYVRGLGSFVPTQRGAEVARTINQHTAHPIKPTLFPFSNPVRSSTNKYGGSYRQPKAENWFTGLIIGFFTVNILSP